MAPIILSPDSDKSHRAVSLERVFFLSSFLSISGFVSVLGDYRKFITSSRGISSFWLRILLRKRIPSV